MQKYQQMSGMQGCKDRTCCSALSALHKVYLQTNLLHHLRHPWCEKFLLALHVCDSCDVRASSRESSSIELFAVKEASRRKVQNWRSPALMSPYSQCSAILRLE